VSALRNEIDEKQAAIEELRDTSQKLTLAHEQLQRDYDRLKEEEQDKSKKLTELLSVNERREQAKQVSNFFSDLDEKKFFFLFTFLRTVKGPAFPPAVPLLLLLVWTAKPRQSHGLV
jgi:hypothetical protein